MICINRYRVKYLTQFRFIETDDIIDAFHFQVFIVSKLTVLDFPN